MSDPTQSDPSTHVAAGQQHHPSVMRQRVPLLKALLKLLPDCEGFSGNALEVATGTGAFLEVAAPAFPHLIFQPSEYTSGAR